ncbi:MAG: radical SAM protein [Chloroflexota bacterium]
MTDQQKINSFDIGPYRPPSEAYSLLIRATINCPWNRCRFCNMYKGAKFQLRTVDEIKQDIEQAKTIQDKIVELARDSGGSIEEAAAAVLRSSTSHSIGNVALWLYGGGENAFLQDANSLVMRTVELADIIRFLRTTLPTIKRVTSYGRSKTAAKKTPEEMAELKEAGLSRIHIGLETGYDPLLEYMDKGVTATEEIAGGRRVVESGISLCEYVLLGLGGKKMWREHAIETARVLNEINPDFIRIRTLRLNSRIPLLDEIEKGNFTRLTDEETVEEERLLIENLECTSNFVSDHISNLLQEVEGKLPEDKGKMLAIIDEFRALSPEEKINFRVGRRMGIYVRLDDLQNPGKRQSVNDVLQRLKRAGRQIDEAIDTLVEGYL